MTASARFDFRRLNDVQKSAVLLSVNVRDKLMLRRSAKIFRKNALHIFLMRSRFRWMRIMGPEEPEVDPDPEFNYADLESGSIFILRSEDGLDDLDLVIGNPTIPMRLDLSTLLRGASEVAEKEYSEWHVTKELGTEEAACKFVNRLLMALPPHAVRFDCRHGDGQVDHCFREQLDILRSPMLSLHFQQSPPKPLEPLLREELRLSRKPHGVAIGFYLCLRRDGTPRAAPPYHAIFEQVAHFPRISLTIPCVRHNFWGQSMEIFVPLLEAALVSHRPSQRAPRILTFTTVCASRPSDRPVCRPIDLIEKLGAKISINDRIEIYRCDTMVYRTPNSQGKDEVRIYLAQNCEDMNAEWRMEKVLHEKQRKNSGRPENWIKEWPIAEELKTD